VGVGDDSATALAATITWIMKGTSSYFSLFADSAVGSTLVIVEVSYSIGQRSHCW